MLMHVIILAILLDFCAALVGYSNIRLALPIALTASLLLPAYVLLHTQDRRVK